ncbi:TPA: TlyA family rRNA (cytidine-2'-O)-methyltransferase [Candidatus Taylorbacteria bacterium]|nr:TlyA family rRNA (cytidine-2'-O)-methyltransferase [Candidatus Taylorbacteria bacterium]
MQNKPDERSRDQIRERIDMLLMERGLARSRSAAVVLIERGSVRVNGVVVDKASRTVLFDAKIEVTEPLAFVSRAGEKLEHALSTWNIPVQGLIAADIGASTGGFTDCLLKRGAEKVYAIDVGTGQLDTGIRNNPKVVSIEQTDVRGIQLPELVDLVTIDVSFISLTHVLETTKNLLKNSGTIIALVKPQFEVGPGHVDRRGVVSDEFKRKEALEKIKSEAKRIGLTIQAETTSPIVGSAGNIEYLLWLTK